MNLRKLLALDRSFIWFSDGSTRYRMRKNNLLPEFGNSSGEAPRAQSEEGATASVQNPVFEKPRRELSFLGFKIQLPFSKPSLVRPEVRSPFPTPKPTLKGAIAFQTEVLENRKSHQANNLLNQVSVVRNDLNDSGVEILSLRRPPGPGKQAAGSLAAAEPTASTVQPEALTS